MNNIIQVFEYDTLYVDGELFTEREFAALVRFNEKHKFKYFDIGNRRIRFKNYVGVIQAGQLIVEILPKADRNENDKNKWHKGLINLLKECRYLPIYATSDASLNTQNSSLIDLYFETYLLEVDLLIKKGLIKRYRTTQSNLTALKGRLEFTKNISKNLVHKERFYVSHQVYDKSNIYNQILSKALGILSSLSTNPHIVSKARDLSLSFEDLGDIKITGETFKKLQFDRKSEGYKRAITLAKLIILHFSPTLHNGQENVIAFLFDMNILFERYLYLQLKKVENEFETLDLTIENQTSRNFWQSQTIRPDILINYSKNEEPKRIIIDTKWKIINDQKPSDADLKQMFAYNIHFGASKSVLLYPKVDQENSGFKNFEASTFYSQAHSCQLMFVDFLEDDGGLRKGVGVEVMQKILFE